MLDNTSCYYDNFIIQYDSSAFDRDYKGWKVSRYRRPAKYYRTKDEAYRAAVQLLFDAMTEGETDVEEISDQGQPSEILQEEG